MIADTMPAVEVLQEIGGAGAVDPVVILTVVSVCNRDLPDIGLAYNASGLRSRRRKSRKQHRKQKSQDPYDGQNLDQGKTGPCR